MPWQFMVVAKDVYLQFVQETKTTGSKVKAVPEEPPSVLLNVLWSKKAELERAAGNDNTQTT